MSMAEFAASFPITTFILALTVLTSLLAWQSEAVYRSFILHPYSVVREKRYYTLLTSGLIHGDFPHLLFNMMTFYFFSPDVEASLGSVGFLIVYLAGLVLSDITTLLKRRDDPNYFCLGASGAVVTVLFCGIVYHPEMKIYFMLLPVPIPAILFAGLYIGYSYFSARHRETHINHEAHLWGAVTGLLILLVLDPRAFVGFFRYLQTLVA